MERTFTLVMAPSGNYFYVTEATGTGTRCTFAPTGESVDCINVVNNLDNIGGMAITKSGAEGYLSAAGTLFKFVIVPDSGVIQGTVPMETNIPEPGAIAIYPE